MQDLNYVTNFYYAEYLYKKRNNLFLNLYSSNKHFYGDLINMLKYRKDQANDYLLQQIAKHNRYKLLLLLIEHNLIIKRDYNIVIKQIIKYQRYNMLKIMHRYNTTPNYINLIDEVLQVNNCKILNFVLNNHNSNKYCTIYWDIDTKLQTAFMNKNEANINCILDTIANTNIKLNIRGHHIVQINNMATLSKALPYMDKNDAIIYAVINNRLNMVKYIDQHTLDKDYTKVFLYIIVHQRLEILAYLSKYDLLAIVSPMKLVKLYKQYYYNHYTNYICIDINYNDYYDYEDRLFTIKLMAILYQTDFYLPIMYNLIDFNHIDIIKLIFDLVDIKHADLLSCYAQHRNRTEIVQFLTDDY